MRTEEVVIDSQFQGPPSSGNGGYVVGMLAEGIKGPTEVSLRVPPPLGRPLTLLSNGERSDLYDGDLLVAAGTRAVVGGQLPAPVSISTAAMAAKRFIGFDRHVFPRCFVCGPDRADGDGLRIFAGPIDDGVVAGVWNPNPSFAKRDGLIDCRVIWAALDCPSYYAISGSPFALLGRLAGSIERRPPPGEELVVMGWGESRSGRKHRNGSAIFSSSGELIASSTATWIELEDLPMPPGEGADR